MPDATGGWIIGTDPTCDMTVTDQYASRFHARVIQHRGRAFVADLGSTNGTYVELPNGTQVKVRFGTEIEIHPGYAVVVGRTRIPWTVPAHA